MQFISIYRLAELCDIKTDRMDIFSVRDIQSALQKLYTSDEIELYHIGKTPITLAAAVDWLWKSNSSEPLGFCQWVHEIPGLEFYLETNQLNNDLSSEIPDKIRKSFNFDRFGNFLAPFLEPNLVNDIKEAIVQKDFARANSLLDFSALLPRSAQPEIDVIYSESLVQFQDYFKDFEDVHTIDDASGFQFLNSQDFKTFLDRMGKAQDIQRAELLGVITNSLDGLKNGADLDLKNQIATMHSLVVKQHFETPEIKIFQDKPSIQAKPKKTVTHINQGPSHAPKKVSYPKTSSGRKISPLHMVGIAFGIFVLIFRVAMHNSESDYDSSDYSLPDYGTDSDFGSSGYFSDYNWESNIDIIKAYVEENENLGDFKVSAMDDWYDKESEESISEPFNEFFYPLYNKDGVDGFEIINYTNYAVIILVKGDDDCYSYFAESKSSYEEYFDLKKDDELMFYFGKEYEETEDLDESEIAGFHYVDRNSIIFLDSIYTVGYGINPDFDNEDDSFDYSIKIEEIDGVPSVSFDYYRTVKSEERDIF